MRPRLRVALFVALAAALPATPPARAFSPSSTTTDTLAELNKAARAAYAVGKAENLARTGPVIVVGDDLLFIRDGERTQMAYLPPLYTMLKTVSHFALGAVVVLRPFEIGRASGREGGVRYV